MNNNKNESEGIRPLNLARIAAVVLAAWFFMAADPLGIEEATADQSERFISRIDSPRYHSSGRVVVIHIDEGFLDAVGESWPLSYQQQGVLLRWIMKLDPSAVFLDLLYARPHGRFGSNDARAVDNPANLLKGVPPTLYDRLFVAALADEGAGNCEARRRAVELKEGALNREGLVAEIKNAADIKVAAVDWEGCGSSYPLVLYDDRGQKQQTYAHTAAYALYRADCKRFSRPCTLNVSADADLPRMALRWGAFPPSAQKPFYAEDACQRHAGATEDTGDRVPRTWRFAGVLKQFFIAMLSGSKQNSGFGKLPCPAVTVLPASAFRAIMMSGDSTQRVQLAKLFRNNFVLVGVKLPGVSDVGISPVHGQLTGVELHAMALDNLLSLGSDYVRAPPDGWSSDLFNLRVLILFAAAAVAAARFSLSPQLPGMAVAALGLTFWVAFAFFNAHEKSMFVLFGLAGGILLDLLCPRETTNMLLVFVVVCCVALLSIDAGHEPRDLIVLALTCFAVCRFAYRAALPAEVEEEDPGSDSLIRGVISFLKGRQS